MAQTTTSRIRGNGTWHWIAFAVLIAVLCPFVRAQVGRTPPSPPPEPERFLQGGVHYFAVQNLETGEVVWQGKTQTSGIAFGQIALAPNTPFRFWILQAGTFAFANPSIVTPGNGQKFEVPEFNLQLQTFRDSDGDGLHDVGEFILGTINDPANEQTKDSDADGIPDGVEVEFGLDPWDGVGGIVGFLAAVNTRGRAIDVAAFDDVVVVANIPDGVSIFNVFNGMDPVIIARVATPGEALAVAVGGNLVGVADGTSGLTVVDFSDPPAAHISARIQLPGSAQAITIAADTAYVGVDQGQVLRVDMRTGFVFDLLDFGASVQDVFLSGDHLFVLALGRLHVVNVDKGAFEEIGSVATSSDVNVVEENVRMRLFVGDGIAYVVDRKGYRTIDVSDPEDPTEIATDPTAQVGWKQIVLDGSGRALAAVSPNVTFDGPHNVAVYDVSDPAINDAFQREFLTPGIARAVSLYNAIGYIADDLAGMQSLRFAQRDSSIVPPTIELDFGFDNNEVEEGQLARVTALVTDNAQVRNVEFYIDGDLVATDGNFPFEHRFVAPRLSQQDSFLLQGRASDTGGNATFTQEYTINLLADSTPPRVIANSPRVGARTVDSVSVFFNEPLDPEAIPTDVLTLVEAGEDGILGTADDVAIEGDTISLRGGNDIIDLNLGGMLPDGKYRAVADSVQDRAGNALEDPFGFEFLVGDANFWVNIYGGQWDDPGNWSEGSVPAADDDVILNHLTGTVVFPGGDATVKSLASSGDFTLKQGNLTVTEGMRVDGLFRMENGRLVADSLRIGGKPDAGLQLIRGTIQDTRIIPAPSSPMSLESATLDGVTVDGDMDVILSGFSDLAIVNGLTLNGTLRVPLNTRITFGAGTQTLGGDAEIILGGAIDQSAAGSLVTFGPNVTLSGSGTFFQRTSSTRIINQGIMRADVSGSKLLIGSFFFSNEGAIEATNGGILELGGQWENTGTLRVEGGTLQLGGEFGRDEIGVIERAGGPVVITGVFDNTGTAYTLNATTGDWLMVGGTLRNGTLTTSAGARLLVERGTLDGPTVEGDIDVVSSVFSNLAIVNGLTLNGALRVPFNTRITFGEGTQTLSGDAEIILGGAIDQSAAGSLVTFGPNVILSGSGTFFQRTSSTRIINQGTMRADVSGSKLSIGSFFFSNEGAIEAKNGGILELGGQWENAGTLRVEGGTLQLGGEFERDDIGVIERAGGPVVLTGLFDNTETSFELNATTGDWEMIGGILRNGTLTTSDGTRLLVVRGTLDGAAVNGAIEMVVSGFSNLGVENGLTLNGSLAVPVNTRITFNGDPQMFSGNADVSLAGSIMQGNASVVTIGADVLIHGDGFFGRALNPTTIINQGTVRAEGSGKDLAIGTHVFTNEGTFASGKGAVLDINTDVTSTATADVTIDIGGPATTQFGRVTYQDGADLLGSLNLNLVDGYEPVLDQELQLITFGSLTNPFTSATGMALPNSLKFDLIYGATDLTLKAVPE